jgi:hypothetical protein
MNHFLKKSAQKQNEALYISAQKNKSNLNNQRIVYM